MNSQENINSEQFSKFPTNSSVTDHIKKEKEDDGVVEIESKENQVHIFDKLVDVKIEDVKDTIDEDKPLREKKRTRKKNKDQIPAPFSHLLDEVSAYHDLDVSEEFLTTILKYVDDLCNIISNGDPNLERTMEVNQNLNNAVSIYRNKLQSIEPKIEEDNNDFYDDYHENYDNGIEENGADENLDDKNFEPVVKKPRGKKKKRLKGVPRIKEEKGTPSYLKAKTIDIDDVVLFQYLKFDMDTKKFECNICNKSTALRHNAFIHLKLRHENELKMKDEDPNSLIKDDCGNRSCKKLFGLTQRRLWCKQCTSISRIPKKYYYYTKIADREHHEAKFELCPECGKNVQHLKAHIRVIHNNTKQICPHCNLECNSVKYLKQHVQTMHEKVPCVECGKLYGIAVMKRHIQAQHTPSHERKFKCAVCGKGFATNQRLKDHDNVHTGNKPYKCKFCSACFASRGTHAMHQRSHLGHHRSNTKKTT